MRTARWEDAFEREPVGGPPLVGDVVEFDDDVGVGVIELGPGRRVDFHCTAITDGSRRIEVGRVVAVVIRPGHLGRLEARSVRPLPGVAPPGSTLEVAVPGSSGLGGRGQSVGDVSASPGDGPSPGSWPDTDPPLGPD